MDEYCMSEEYIPFFYTKDRKYLYLTRERIFWLLQTPLIP
jgi:hypothetical protein